MKTVRDACLVRETVNTLNRVVHHTQDEQVYAVISRRMIDRYEIFDSLPDTIEGNWIESVDVPEERVDQHIHLRDRAQSDYEARYREVNDHRQGSARAVPERTVAVGQSGQVVGAEVIPRSRRERQRHQIGDKRWL